MLRPSNIVRVFVTPKDAQECTGRLPAARARRDAFGPRVHSAPERRHAQYRRSDKQSCRARVSNKIGAAGFEEMPLSLRGSASRMSTFPGIEGTHDITLNFERRSSLN